MKKIILILGIIFCGTMMFAQRHGHGGGGRGHHHGHGPRVVKRSVYRPARVTVFHPHWRPGFGYHRRWVYFPRYNFYWDNWRNSYMFYSGGAWVVTSSPPPAVVNVDLSKEKHRELKEDEDDVDDVYRSNNEHKESEKEKQKSE
jgi:hypothetical protein